jgi:hypothetical protein
MRKPKKANPTLIEIIDYSGFSFNNNQSKFRFLIN